jgi:methionyl aminopeptidase
VLTHLQAMVVEGISTMDLEVEAGKLFDAAGAKPAFKGYFVPAANAKFPYVLCTSVNDEIVHGMPNAKRKLKSGDIVSIDTGASLEGYFGDSAITVPIHPIPPAVAKLLEVTKQSLELAIEQMQVGNRLFDVSGAVQRYVESNGFSVVREFVGHGIGSKLHEEPQVPNYVDRRSENPRLKEGMALAIEPMVNQGKPESKVLSDRFTAVTTDGTYSAHFEHVVVVTEKGPQVLTRP